MYQEVDAGIWELRGLQRIHTFSSLMCWAACDRLATVAAHLHLPQRAVYWTQKAAAIRKVIMERAWNSKIGSFISTFEGERLDASLLLISELQFLAPDDPRFIGTLRAVEKHLQRGDFLLRYDKVDDFGRPDSAVIVCTLWWILALANTGETARARRLFENILKCQNHLGLLSEDVSIDGKELWGNFPRAYSMVGLIQCAARLSIPWGKAY